MKKSKAVSEPSKKKKLCVILLCALLVFGVFQTLNFTGFCYSEGRYLSDQEIIDRYLLGSDWKNITEVDIANHPRVKKFKEENPFCCEIDRYGLLKRTAWESWDSILLNRLFGRYRFAITVRYKPERTEQWNEPYLLSNSLINACGNRSWSWGEMPLSQKEYDSYIVLKSQQKE